MHRGIEIRITTPAGVIFQCDSDFAHDTTVFHGTPVGEWRTVLSHVDVAGGAPLLDDSGAAAAAGARELLRFELRAVELPDVEVPDDAGELLELEDLYGPPDANCPDPAPDMPAAPDPGGGGDHGAAGGQGTA